MVSRVLSCLACIFVYLANGQLSVEENEVRITQDKATNNTLKSPRSNIKGILLDIPWPARKGNLSLTKQHNNPYVNIQRNEKVSIAYKRNKPKVGRGWPNFSEIMRSRKKWKKHICKNNRNIAKTKTHLKHCNVEVTDRYSVYNMTKHLENDDFLNFVKQTKNSENRDQNNNNKGDMHGYKHMSSMSINRPNFQYHRVTSSPHDQHKSNAILALSVVRRNNLIGSSTPRAVSTSSAKDNMKWRHELQVSKLKSISGKSRLRHHGHHLHPARADINGLHH